MACSSWLGCKRTAGLLLPIKPLLRRPAWRCAAPAPALTGLAKTVHPTLAARPQEAVAAVEAAAQSLAAPQDRLKRLLEAKDKKAMLLEMAGGWLAGC